MKQRIAIIHPQLKEGGGSEAAALWAVEALKDDHDVTLISMGAFDLRHLDRSFGTRVFSSGIRVVRLRIPLLLRRRFDALRAYRLSRYCLGHSRDYDVMISTYNPMNFGKRGIQIIADFSFDDDLRNSEVPRERGIRRLWHRPSWLRKTYLGIGRLLAGDRHNDWKKNCTLANSLWSQALMKEKFGLESLVVYPPVQGSFPDKPFSERENGFVVIGRLVPEKGIDNIIGILGRVRDKGGDVHLHILGRADDSAYKKKIENLARTNRDWVFLEGVRIGKEKEEILTAHRFGISGCLLEAFGIAVAEMVMAGCIVWVPDGGGQKEIVNHSDLIYQSEDDAVEKIMAMLDQPERQEGIRLHLKKQAELFSAARFQREIRRTLDIFLESEKKD